MYSNRDNGASSARHRDSPSELRWQSDLTAARERHRVYAESRRMGYVPRAGALQRLDAHLDSATTPLVITAPAGAGKSALAAYWADRVRGRGDWHVVEYYVGMAAADHFGVLRHLLLELRELVEAPDALPSAPEELVEALNGLLVMTRRTPLLLVIDGLEQLRDIGDGIGWLPHAFPSHVRIVLTTRDGALSEQLAGRGWPTMTVEPLSLSERLHVVQRFVAERTVDLTPGQISGITHDVGSSNPLLLRTRLEEMRLSAGSGDVDATIDYFLDAQSLGDLFNRIFERMEQEHGEPMVREVTSMLYASRAGLDRRDLAALVQRREGDLLPLMSRMMAHLLPRNGLLTYYHDDIRDTVRHRYMADDAGLSSAHRKLAAYFHDLFERHLAHSQHAVEVRLPAELAFHLMQCGDRDRLFTLLARPPVAFALYDTEHHFDYLRYCRQVSEERDLCAAFRDRADEFIASAPPSPLIPGMLESAASTVHALGGWDVAEDLYRREISLARDAGAAATEASGLGELGRVLRQKGRYDEALTCYEEQRGAARIIGNERQIAIATGNIGIIHSEQGRFAEALACHQEQLEIAERIGDQRQVTKSLACIATLHGTMGDCDAAVRVQRRVLEIAEQTGDLRRMAYVAEAMARIYAASCDYTAALASHNRKYDIASELGDRRQMAIAIGNMGLMHFELLDDPAALECFSQSLTLAESLGYKRQIMWAAWALGDLHCLRGDFSAAVTYAHRQRSVAEDVGDPTNIALAIDSLGSVAFWQGTYERALELFDESLQQHRTLGYKYGIGSSAYHAARALLERETQPGRRTDGEALTVARLLAEAAVATAGEIDRVDLHFDATLLAHRITFELDPRASVCEATTALRSSAPTDPQRAAVLYEIGRMKYMLGDADARHDLAEAASLFEALVLRTCRLEFAVRLRELRLLLAD